MRGAIDKHGVSTHLVGVGSVSLLPQELASAEERCCLLELPTHHVGPLVHLCATEPRWSGQETG